MSKKTWSGDEVDLVKSEVTLHGDSTETRKSLAKRLSRSKNSIRSKINDLKREGSLETVTDAKVFVFDIETSTIVFRNFSPKVNGYIPHKNIIRDWFVISWAGRWLGKKEMLSDVLTPQEAKRSGNIYNNTLDDKRICQSLWDIFNEADILVAHNGDNFDIKKMNYRFRMHGFRPPLPYKTFDTLKEHRKVFGATSNSLDFLLRQMKLRDEKIKTGWELWEACENGDPEALRKMDEYCRHDIELGEKLYLDICKWSHNGNINLYGDLKDVRCPVCGHGVDILEHKKAVTSANAYKTYRCRWKNCGHTGRTRQSTLDAAQRKNLLSP